MSEPGLASDGLVVVGDKFLGLLAEPGGVEPEPAANAKHFLGEIEIDASAGKNQGSGEFAGARRKEKPPGSRRGNCSRP